MKLRSESPLSITEYIDPIAESIGPRLSPTYVSLLTNNRSNSTSPVDFNSLDTNELSETDRYTPTQLELYVASEQLSRGQLISGNYKEFLNQLANELNKIFPAFETYYPDFEECLLSVLYQCFVIKSSLFTSSTYTDGFDTELPINFDHLKEIDLIKSLAKKDLSYKYNRRAVESIKHIINHDCQPEIRFMPELVNFLVESSLNSEEIGIVRLKFTKINQICNEYAKQMLGYLILEINETIQELDPDNVNSLMAFPDAKFGCETISEIKAPMTLSEFVTDLRATINTHRSTSISKESSKPLSPILKKNVATPYSPNCVSDVSPQTTIKKSVSFSDINTLFTPLKTDKGADRTPGIFSVA